MVNLNNGETVDEALLTVMLRPKSYTREDVVEINCHGGPVAVKKTLELALAAGARIAEPGEFTKRAFINGRIDLTQAEAVMDIIAAKTEASLSAAVSQLSGGLKEKIEAIKDALTELLALTEVSIDFSEDEVEPLPLNDLKAEAVRIRSMVRSLLDTFEEGRVLREGIRVAIVGAPNVGKSSLLNRLAGAERAIVTEIPGTTRDTVEELINLGGVPVRVIDTAGIRHSRDIVEREGIRRSEEALKAADLALVVLDGSRELSGEDRAIMEKAGSVRHVVVVNKSDLPQKLIWRQDILPSAAAYEPADASGKVFFYAQDPQPCGERPAVCEGVPVRLSAKTGEGIDELARRVREAIFAGGWARRRASLQEPRQDQPISGEMRFDAAMINLRHKGCLERADAALMRFDKACAENLSPEFLAVELRDALDAVGEVVGKTAPEDVLELIFNRFCIGK